MKWFSFSSLRFRLMLLVFLSIIPSLGLILYDSIQERRSATAQAQQNTLRMAYLIASEHEQIIEGGRQLLITLTKFQEVRNLSSEACDPIFINLLKEYRGYTGFGIVKPNGDLFCSVPPSKEPINVSDRPWFQDVLRTRSFTIGGYQIGRITGKPILVLAHPVLDVQERVKAIVLSGLDLAWINQLAAKLKLPEGATLHVIDQNGTILVRHPEPEKWVGKSMPEAPIIKLILSQGEGVAEAAGVDGVTRHYAFTTLGGIPRDRGLYVSIGIPKTVVFAEADRILKRNLIWLGLVAALALLAAWFFGGLFILRRVNSLLSATKRLAAGDLSARTNLPYGIGELSQLAHAFDQMAESLEHQEAKRKLAEERLRESEKKYRDLVDNALVGVYKTNLKGEILYINEAFLKMLEFDTAEEFKANGALARYKNPKDRGVLIENLKRTGRVTNFETILLTKAEILKNILLSATLDGDTLSGMVMDITERKRAEEIVGRQRDELSAHARILSVIFRTTDLDEQLNLILDEVLAFLRVEFGSIHLVQGNEIVLRCWRGISDIFRAQVLSFPVKEPPEWMQESFVVNERLSEQGQTPDFFKYEGIQAWTSVPLYLPPKEGKEREWLGVLIVCSRHYEALDEDQVRALNNIADQLAMAIDNVRTYRQAQERMARLQTLRDIDKAIMQRHDLMEVLHVVLERVPKELGADAAAISLLDEKQSEAKVFAMRLPNGTVIEQEAFILADSLLYWFVNQQKPVVIYDLTQDPRVQMHRESIRNGRLISYLGVPLIVKDKTIGILHILTTQPKVFSDEDVGFFSTMAGQTAIAIENARATEALRESEEKYRTMIEHSNDMIWTLDREGNFTYINKTAEEVSGYKLADWVGKSFAPLIPPEDLPRIEQIFLETMSGKPQHYEVNVLRGNGSIFVLSVNTAPIFESGKVTGTVSFGRDITEQRKADEVLRSEKERFQTLSESAPFGMVIIDKDGKFKYVNSKFKELFGYDLRDVPNGKTWFRKAYPDATYRHDAISTWITDLKSYTSGEKRTRIFKVTCKDGTEKIINFIPIKLESGENLMACEDITERRQLEEQLRQSQKMEAIGQLAGGIAHDFNNLLTVIKGYSQLALLELKEGDSLWGNIDVIRNSAERAASLTRQLLAFSRRQILDLKVLDLNTILHNLDKMLLRIIGEDIELVTVLAEDLGRVKTDPGQIEQVIMNLAVNARDAMPNGGKLTIETANVELDEVYAHNHIAVKPGRYVILSVSDTGVGMTPEVKERVFEPFFTTKEKDKGTGLGLSTVYGIVKQSGGNIWVYSELGQGTTFKIYLPQVDEPLEVWGEKVVEEIPRGNETILIVEDDEAVRKLALRILERQGYMVLEAHDVDEVSQICEDMKEPIHLILTDVVMPQLSGRQLVEQISQVRQDFKVLYMSGYADNAIVHHGVLEKGMNFIQKPFTLEGLARKVREVLDK